jgi:small subunit ribosomal protein S4
MKLFLKGERCLSPKCAMERRGYAPGMHGKTGQFRRQVSDYGQQLREKQRLRRFYGVLENQFRRYYSLALRYRGQTGANLLIILERRLDNIVYRLACGFPRPARQLVLHGHFAVNGRKMTFLRRCCRRAMCWRAGRSQRNSYFRELRETLEHQSVPDWMSLNAEGLSGQLVALPTREQIDTPVNEQLIVEFYSR